MPDGKVICKNCGSTVDASEVICPECGLGLEPAEKTSDLLDFSDLDEGTGDSTSGSLDDLLDFEDIDEESDEEIASFLGLDAKEEEPASPAIPSFHETSPAVPSMEEVSPAIPSFEESSPAVPSLEETSPAIPDVGTPAIPTFDSLQEVETVEEEVSEEVVAETTVLELGVKPLISLYFLQWLYWFVVFFIINVASITVLSPSLTLENLLSTMIAPSTSPLGEAIYVFNSLSINPVLYIFSWLSFFVMGWFHRYRLLQFHVRPRWYHAVVFILGFFAFSMAPAIVFSQLTPSIIIQLYFVLIPFEFLITFVTAGVGTYILGYSFLFGMIYRQTPVSKLPDNKMLVEN